MPTLSKPQDPAPATKKHGRSWHRTAGKPVRWWMTALILVLGFHRWIPDTRWLMVHMVTLGLITTSIMVWSQHFTEALLHHRLPDHERPRQILRIYGVTAGTVLLMVGMLADWWWLTLVSATIIGGLLTWHGLSLLSQLRTALPARFGITVRWYAVAAFFLPVGAIFGAILALDLADPWHSRLLLTHQAVNVLGFVGLTVSATLLTLWPTMVRTRMEETATALSRIALPAMAAGSLVAAGGALGGWVPVVVLGLFGYAVGVGLVGRIMIRTGMRKLPEGYMGWSVASGIAWLFVTVVIALILVAVQGIQTSVMGALTIPFVAGFLLQTLLGAMSYILPSTMGGGPATVRASLAAINRGGVYRVTVLNLCIALFALPAGMLPSWVRAVVSIVGAVAFAAFIPLMISSAKVSGAGRRRLMAQRAAGQAPATDTAGGSSSAAASTGAPDRKPNPLRQIVAGVLTVLLAVGAGIAVAPQSAGIGLSSGTENTVQATGNTTEITMHANQDMRFDPGDIEVPVGDRLVITLINDDPTNVHDLVFANGATSGRVGPGDSAVVDAGIITEPLEGWCSVIGHRSMGMTVTVIPVDEQGNPVGTAGHEEHGAGGAPPAIDSQDPAADVDFNAAPGEALEARDPALDPAPNETVHELTLDVQEVAREVAPGVTLDAWTFNGDYTGPTLRGKVGDVFEVTLTNSGSMGHSVDFHAGDVSPDETMRTIAPGESLVYRFEAVRSGIWLYHCATAPMSTHVAAGMFGAVIIDPPDLPEVDREYLLVQNETYVTVPPAEQPDLPDGVNAVVDPAAIAAGTPSLTMFNGHATQYMHDKLPARTDERVRIWVLAAGPSKGTSFHVVGGQFDTVYKEGAYLLSPSSPGNPSGTGGAQALDLAPAQGGFVEMSFPEAGTYTFVNHSFAEAERGARGQIEVTE